MSIRTKPDSHKNTFEKIITCGKYTNYKTRKIGQTISLVTIYEDLRPVSRCNY
jgi:hypothetical protein